LTSSRLKINGSFRSRRGNGKRSIAALRRRVFRQEQLIPANVLGTELIGWFAEVLGELPDVITDDPADDWDPAFTPDGRKILWSSSRRGHLEIWMAWRGT
jgi:hypothetical protein